MNIRIFLLKGEQNTYAARLTPELKCIFADYLASEESVQSYASIRDASEEIRLLTEERES